MSIPPVNPAADALLAVQMRTHSLVPVQPATPAPARMPGVGTPTSETATDGLIPNVAQLQQALGSVNQAMQKLAPGLEFAIDPDSSRTVVKVVDQQTGDVIRQMPSAEALEIAKALDKVQGLLISQRA